MNDQWYSNDPHRAIHDAHQCLHMGQVEEAHEILHRAGAGTAEFPPPRCLTGSLQAAALAELVRAFDATKLPCGHSRADLTWAPGTVTRCGACVAATELSQWFDEQNGLEVS